MFLALWQALADFLYRPAPYMLVQAWLLVLALWWAYHARRMAPRMRFWFVPAGGLVAALTVGLLAAAVVFNQHGRYTPWWLLRAAQVIAAYFLIWAWSAPLDGRKELEWYRGLLALLGLVGLPGSFVLHALGPGRWPALELGWTAVGVLVGAGAFIGTVLVRPDSAAWLLTTAALFTLGFAADLTAGGDWRGAARLAELAAYPLLLWWPEVHSAWRAARARWQERVQTLEKRLQAAHARLEELETEASTLRANALTVGRGVSQDWCERGGYPFWQAFADTLRTLQHTLHSLSSAAVWRSLPPSQRDALLRLDAVAQFHQHALEVAARREVGTGDWMPWAHIWNRVLQDMGTFAQSKDQVLVLALPDEIFTWSAPEEPTYNALYFVLARALWVSPPRSEVLVHGQVVNMEPGGLGVMLEISDRGPALSEEDQVRIFFATEEEANPTSAAEAMGADLGLRLARRQLLAIQGSLWVTSAQDGPGATIAVLVPTRRNNEGLGPAAARDATHATAPA